MSETEETPIEQANEAMDLLARAYPFLPPHLRQRYRDLRDKYE